MKNHFQKLRGNGIRLHFRRPDEGDGGVETRTDSYVCVSSSYGLKFRGNGECVSE